MKKIKVNVEVKNDALAIALKASGFKKSRSRKLSWPRVKKLGTIEVDCTATPCVNIHFKLS